MVSNVRSYAPATWQTSVDVPPMSKPMMASEARGARGFRRADDTARRTRQHRILAARLAAVTRPPLDCIIISRAPAMASAKGRRHSG